MFNPVLFFPLIVLAVDGPSQTSPKMLTIRNTSWDAVRVEVRVGPSTQCDANAHSAVKTLGRDRTWAIVSDEVICWRREQTPGDPNSAWSAWAQTRLALDEVRDVTL